MRKGGKETGSWSFWRMNARSNLGDDDRITSDQISHRFACGSSHQLSWLNPYADFIGEISHTRPHSEICCGIEFGKHSGRCLTHIKRGLPRGLTRVTALGEGKTCLQEFARPGANLKWRSRLLRRHQLRLRRRRTTIHFSITGRKPI
jgi:hypothetical protein